jgi:hypothetical protein
VSLEPVEEVRRRLAAYHACEENAGVREMRLVDRAIRGGVSPLGKARDY